MSDTERLINFKDGREFTGRELQAGGLINWKTALQVFAENWGREFGSTEDQIFADPFPLIRALLLLPDDILETNDLGIVTEISQLV